MLQVKMKKKNKGLKSDGETGKSEREFCFLNASQDKGTGQDLAAGTALGPRDPEILNKTSQSWKDNV